MYFLVETAMPLHVSLLYSRLAPPACCRPHFTRAANHAGGINREKSRHTSIGIAVSIEMKLCDDFDPVIRD